MSFCLTPTQTNKPIHIKKRFMETPHPVIIFKQVEFTSLSALANPSITSHPPLSSLLYQSPMRECQETQTDDSVWFMAHESSLLSARVPLRMLRGKQTGSFRLQRRAGWDSRAKIRRCGIDVESIASLRLHATSKQRNHSSTELAVAITLNGWDLLSGAEITTSACCGCLCAYPHLHLCCLAD